LPGYLIMMSAQRNELITRTGPETPAGKLMRLYWQPAALAEELPAERAVRAIELLGQKMVLFRDQQGRYGLVDRACPHRGADLAFGRLEDGGLRSHIWAPASRPPLRTSIVSSRPTHTPSRSRDMSRATGCRHSKSVSIPRTHHFCIAFSRTIIRREIMAYSFAVRRRTRNC
jgi:Rieske [2Fe-2S] domain